MTLEEYKSAIRAQSQVEEMYKDICEYWTSDNPYMVAQELYEQGYRKIPENAVVLTREEYDDLLIGRDYDYGYHDGEKNMEAYYEKIRLPEERKQMLKDCIESNKVVEEQARKKMAKEIYQRLIELSENPCNSREEIYKAVFEPLGVEVEE